MIKFIRQHIWAHLPKTASRRTVLWSALIWGVIIPVLAGVFHYFGRFSRPTFIGFTAVGLSLGLLQLIPGVGERVYLTILRITAILGYFLFRAGLTVAFYLVVTPMGALLRLFGKDFLETASKPGQPPQWHKHSGRSEPKRYYRLF